MDMIQKCQQVLMHYNYSAIVLSVSIVLLCILIELFVLPFRQTSLSHILHPNKSVLTDLVIGSVYILGILSIAKAMFIAEHTRSLPINLELNKYLHFPLIQFIVSLLVADFLNYWLHRIYHEIEFLWQIHKFHHSATDFIIITGNRTHPFEIIINRLLVFIPLSMLGTPPETYLGILVLVEFIEKMQHSIVDWDWGWFGRNIVFSPIGHRRHHSIEKEHWDKNYGSIFVFWDKMFGTYYHGKKTNESIGVPDNWYNREGLFFDLCKPMHLALKEFWRSIFSRQWKAKHLR